MYSKEVVLEILEAFDLTKSYRAAGALCGVDHHTVAAKVAARAAGLDPGAAVEHPSISDSFVSKILEWIKTSDGLVRADVVHDKLLAKARNERTHERTTRRTVAVVHHQSPLPA